MSSSSKIEWTDASWVVTAGCEHVSPGCDSCYAARLTSGRLKNNPMYVGLARGGTFTGEVRLLPERTEEPLRWKKPRRIFVNSMSDLFYRDVPDEFIAKVFDVMAVASQHQFQVLTKRPQRMAAWVAAYYSAMHDSTPFGHIWLGSSIESDRYVWRADHVRATPAAVRFLSLEPLLGPLPSLDLTGIDWVIVGGESGHDARPMHPDWARDIRDRCVDAGIPFFFKQHGEFLAVRVEDDDDFAGGRAYDDPTGGRTAAVLREPSRKAFTSGVTRLMRAGDANRNGVMLDDDTFALRVGKKVAGRELDGRTWDQYPEGRDV